MPTVRELLDSFNISHLEYCVGIVDKGGPTAEYQGIKIFEEQNNEVLQFCPMFRIFRFLCYQKNRR